MPWISSSTEESGTIALNGQRIGRQAVYSERSPIFQEAQASSTLA